MVDDVFQPVSTHSCVSLYFFGGITNIVQEEMKQMHGDMDWQLGKKTLID